MPTIDYSYLRPKKAEDLKRQHDTFPEISSEVSFWCGKNATILPIRKQTKNDWFGKGGVLDDKSVLVKSAFTSIIKDGYSVSNAEYQDLKVVYCGYLIRHWGHFLVETAARLWYYLENDESVDKYVFVVEDGETRSPEGNYKEFLSLLGILNKAIIINRPTKFKEVIVPDLAYRNRTFCSSKYLKVFDVIAENAKPSLDYSPADKVFLSRTLFSKGRNLEFGGEALDNFWANNGYKVLYPERISLSDTIMYVRNASHVAAVSGTLPHNILFAKQGQNLTICERCAFNNNWQVGINLAKDLNVTYIDSNISLYTVEMTGPFILAYNVYLNKYKQDNALANPNENHSSRKYQIKCFRKYMKSYKQRFGCRWFIDGYLFDKIDYHAEAYHEAEELFYEYLTGSRPIFWQDMLNWTYIKIAIKRILKR